MTTRLRRSYKLLGSVLLVGGLTALLLVTIGSPAMGAAELADRGAAGSGSEPSGANAPPRLCVPYGTVKINASNVPSGTLIAGWCNGSKVDEEPAGLMELEGEIQSLYKLEIPDTDCPAGSTITFTIGSFAAEESMIWVEGQQELNLTGTGFYVYLPLVLR